MIPRINEMCDPPTVGRFYLVPTILYPYYGRTSHWPVIGSKHADIEFFNFPNQHYHIDGRFLNAEQRADLDRCYSGGWQYTIAASPLVTRDGFSERTHPHPAPIWARRKCTTQRVWHPGAPSPQFERLRKAYSGRNARCDDGRLTCPHRGTDLTSIAPDEHGIVTCPLHGLLISRGRVMTLRQIRHAAQVDGSPEGRDRASGLDGEAATARSASADASRNSRSERDAL